VRADNERSCEAEQPVKLTDEGSRLLVPDVIQTPAAHNQRRARRNHRRARQSAALRPPAGADVAADQRPERHQEEHRDGAMRLQ